jgi:hypothetical protein
MGFCCGAWVRSWQCAPKARIISGGGFHPEIYGPAVRCKGNVLNGRYGLRQSIRPLLGDFAPGHQMLRASRTSPLSRSDLVR